MKLKMLIVDEVPKLPSASGESALNGSAQTPPTYIWADFDPSMPKSVRWAFYYSKADQRMTRPDLEPIKLRIVPNAPI